eukprot:scaffold69076_cov30-Tisochrysis_lutea.AAC.2
MGCRRAETIRASWRSRASIVGVTMKRGSSATGSHRGSVASQKPPTSTQCSPGGRAGAKAAGGLWGLPGRAGNRCLSSSASISG